MAGYENFRVHHDSAYGESGKFSWLVRILPLPREQGLVEGEKLHAIVLVVGCLQVVISRRAYWAVASSFGLLRILWNQDLVDNLPQAQWRDLYRVVQIGIGILMHPVQMLCESGQVRLRTCLCCMWVSPGRIVSCSSVIFLACRWSSSSFWRNMVWFACNWPFCFVSLCNRLVYMTMELTNGTYLVRERRFNVNPTKGART